MLISVKTAEQITERVLKSLDLKRNSCVRKGSSKGKPTKGTWSSDRQGGGQSPAPTPAQAAVSTSLPLFYNNPRGCNE